MIAASVSTIFDSPVGPLFARVDAGKLVRLSFARNSFARDSFTRNVERRAQLGDSAPSLGSDESSRILGAVEAQLGEYFVGQRKVFDLPLQLNGPEFHRSVWIALCDIQYGTTISYGELADRLGLTDAARAVGAANGANPIAIIVPCHRVIGADGKLVGYGGGLERKRLLLDLESGRVGLFASRGGILECG